MNSTPWLPGSPSYDIGPLPQLQHRIMTGVKLPSRDIVLLGVGHTNAHVLRMWRMQPIPDTRLTCVSNFPVVTYSGMLPGVLAGQYEPPRMEIDLVRLCAAAGARLIVADVTGVDVAERRVLFADRPAIPFDALSIGIGSVPDLAGIVDPTGSLVAIKPMQTFRTRLAERLQAWSHENANGPLRVCIVGGGVGGVEVTFCLPHFIRRTLGTVNVELAIVHGADSLAPGTLASTSRKAETLLRERGVKVVLGVKVARIESNRVTLSNGESLTADLVIGATSAVAPPLLDDLDLPKDSSGFLLTDPTLRTTAGAPIFVVGDSGTLADDPTPKAGVYAVRQGPIVWQNLQRTLQGEPLLPYRPQRNFLKLLNTGDGRAIGEYRGLTFHGGSLWRWKDWIDSRFMDKYQDYTPMPMAPAANPPSDAPMKCAGCGGKVGMQVLSRALARLDVPLSEHVLMGLESPDDAAVLRTESPTTIATADFFQAPLDDPYLVGRIALLNAASDIFAMGGRPRSALAMVSLPDGPSRQQEELLSQLLAGSLQELKGMNAALVGGHTIEGPNLTIGFSILGEPRDGLTCTKAGAKLGDALILTKPLGSGVLLAAHMQAACPAPSMTALLDTMLSSNQHASELAVECGVTAMTDVTGFGLAGHLMEMLIASKASAEINLDSLPLLPGVESLIAAGIESTLAPSNREGVGAISCSSKISAAHRYAALFDPQTSGGLLIAADQSVADELLARLQEVTDAQAARIGTILDESADVRLRVV